MPQCNHHVTSVALAHIPLETVVDLIASRMVVDIERHSKLIFVLLQEISERLIALCILPVVVVVHTSHVLSLDIVIISQEIKELTGLRNRKISTL